MYSTNYCLLFIRVLESCALGKREEAHAWDERHEGEEEDKVWSNEIMNWSADMKRNDEKRRTLKVLCGMADGGIEEWRMAICVILIWMCTLRCTTQRIQIQMHAQWMEARSTKLFPKQVLLNLNVSAIFVHSLSIWLSLGRKLYCSLFEIISLDN